MRPLSVVIVAVALILTACGDESGRVAEDGMDGADFTSRITVDGDSLTIEYTLRNTGESTLVAFDRGWIADGSSPREPELAATRDDVQVIVDGDTVEFGLRIIHDCHGNPQGELPGDTHGTDCDGDAPVSQRIAATRLEPGDSVTRDYTFDVASVWPDYPTEQAQTTIDLSGKEVRFCLGVDRPKSPSKDDLYPPDTAERVLCGDPVAVD